MNASKLASGQKLGSDLQGVDAHVIQADEHEDLPEISVELLARQASTEAAGPGCRAPAS